MLVALHILRELLGFSSISNDSDFSLTDNKAAALLMLTNSVDFVKDAHEEMERVRVALSLLVIRPTPEASIVVQRVRPYHATLTLQIGIG